MAAQENSKSVGRSRRRRQTGLEIGAKSSEAKRSVDFKILNFQIKIRGELMALLKGFGTVEAAAERVVRPIVEEHGYTLWDVVFIKEGAAWYLRILIDKPEGISIDDCTSIDGLINAEIDKQDFIDKIDYLEIGSAGLERHVRRVEQLGVSVGKRIVLKTYKLCEGLPEKRVRCVLERFDGERLTVSGEFGTAEITVSEISGINYDDFDDFNDLMS